MVWDALEMTGFTIDTGWSRPEVMPTTAGVEETQRIVITTWARAQNLFNKISANIQVHELPDDLDDYWAREEWTLDALHLFDPTVTAELQDIYETHRAMLVHAGIQSAAKAADPNPAEPGSNGSARHSANEGNQKMFKINTGATVSQGPWIAWTSNGSAMKGFQPMKWILRDKDDQGNKVENMVPAFESGCVMDIDSLKLGWEKDGAQGQAPERRWNPSISQDTPRPDESKKASGAFSWSRALSVRCAIGNGQAATWEQGSFAAYRAFEKLAPQIEQGFKGDGTLPLVKQTGVEQVKLPNGSANIPTLTIVKWVPRPDCLKADAPQIDTGSMQAQQTAPAPQPVPAATADDDDLPF